MQLWIDTFQVVERDGFAEQLLVEGQCETSVQVMTVEDRNADDATNEVKI